LAQRKALLSGRQAISPSRG